MQLLQRHQYQDFFEELTHVPRDEASAHLRNMALNDLYFLLRYICKLDWMDHPWLFDRCREVQADPDGKLDLWARGHCKSTIITFGLTLQEILNRPESRICILSYNRPTAKAFLQQLMTEMEQNEDLKALFPDVLYADPRKESPKWSADEGLRVKRTANPKENTVEAFGLIDGQPTSRHYDVLVYDDVVTLEGVSSPDMIKKVTRAWQMSENLSSGDTTRKRYIGTRYDFLDTWNAVIESGVPVRKHSCFDESGVPVLLSEAGIEAKRRTMGSYVFASQMLLNPIAEGMQVFKEEWVKYWRPAKDGPKFPKSWNYYIIVDPASKKKKTSDFTAMWVLAACPDRCFRACRLIHKRMSLKERTDALFALVEEFAPRAVGYEQYGKDSDIEHIEEEMNNRNFRFRITPLGGKMAKEDRIRRVQPHYENGRILHLEGDAEQEKFIRYQLLMFPAIKFDDALDGISRIVETVLHVTFPKAKESWRDDPYRDAPKTLEDGGSWMTN